MKQKLQLIAIIFMMGFCSVAFSQSSLTDKIPYQAIARDASGQVLAKQNLFVRVSLASQAKQDDGKAYYSELHQLQTDENGYFSIAVGDGQAQIGEWGEVPWYLGSLNLDVEIDASGTTDFRLFSRSELQSVPYAITAKTAERLVDPQEIDERTNFSIHWNTSGNFKTVPHVHFIGTRDDKDFYVKTTEKTRIVFSNRGQMTIYADDSKKNSGGQGNPEDYQLYIKGEEHGAYIEINESRTSANNFLTFADEGDIRGRIEGQTVAELMMCPSFVNTNRDFAASLTVQIAVTAAEFAQGAGYAAAAAAAGASIFFAWKVPGYATASGGAFGLGAAAVAATASIIAQTIEYNVTTIGKAGVSFSSGGADYAEFLLRNPSERDLFPGEIIGVKKGEISLNTKDADHLMVISEAPAMLGNVPSPQRIELFEKVAFMGQVPVKVIGKVESGDYIIPSGLNDGVGIAIKAADLPTRQYQQIVGVAWENIDAKEDEINKVNISVGLNHNDLAPRVERLESKVDNIIAFLEGKEELMEEEALSPALAEANPSQAVAENSFTASMMEEYIEKGEPTIRAYYAMLEDRMNQEGINLREYPVWAEILNDPISYMKEMSKDPTVAQRWANIANHNIAQPD